MNSQDNFCIEVSLDDCIPKTDKGGEVRVGISPLKNKAKSMIMGTVEIKPGDKFEKHIHDKSDEAIYVIDGKGILFIQNCSYKLVKNHMYFVNKGKKHSIINDGNTTLKIVFASAPLDNICSEIQWKYPPTPAEGMTLLQNRAPEVYEEFRKLTQILNENSPIDRKTKELILLGIFTAIGGKRGIKTHTQIASEYGATEEEIIAAILYALPISGITTITEALENVKLAIEKEQ